MDDPSAPGAPAIAHRAATFHDARVARALALAHCPQGIGADCSWYHGVWQYLQGLGLVKRAGGQEAFLRSALPGLMRAGDAQRVLVSGAADDALTSIVLDTYQQAGSACDLTLIDRCEAPLALSRWSAARAGGALQTRQADALVHASERPYDVVIANSFLGYIEPGDRARLFANWALLLGPGGKLLLTNRIRPEADPGPLRLSAALVEAFCETVRAAAHRQRAALGIEPEEIVRWARDYVVRLAIHPVRSVDEMLALLSAAGFVPDRIDCSLSASAPIDERFSGPTLAGRADFVRLVATRP